MKVIRESTHISGFLYDRPVQELASLTHCGEALCARGHSLRPHAHPGFEFHYLSRGGPFGWRVGGAAFTQRMGEVFVTYPQELHVTGPQAYPETHFLWIGLRLADLGPTGRRLGKRLSGERHRVLPACHEVEPVLRGLVAQVVSQRPGRTAAVRAYLETLIALLEQRLLSATAAPGRPVALLPYSHTTIKAISYLEKHLERRVPLRELAAAAAQRAIANFCTHFRREVGLSPAAYHRRLRLQAAREALRQPAFTITTAALQFGFSSSQHFSAAFRQEFNTSPRRWQQAGGR